MSRLPRSYDRVSWITTRENSTRRKWGVVRVAGAIVGSSVLLLRLERGISNRSSLYHRVFLPVLAKAGIRRIRLHDLRHTFGSLLLQNGASIVYVKEQMGHSSIQVTVDIYGHLIPGAYVLLRRQA